MHRESGASSFQLFATDDSFGFIRALGRAIAHYPDRSSATDSPMRHAHVFQNAGFLADLAIALEERLRSVHYHGPLRAHPRREYSWLGEQPADVGPAVEQAVSAMLSSGLRDGAIAFGQGMSRTLEQHVAWWLKELGLIRDFHVARLTAGSPLYQVKVRKFAEAPETLITDVGFEVSQILPVLVLCFYATTGSTIILEQPEINLHPSVQARLADCPDRRTQATRRPDHRRESQRAVAHSPAAQDRRRAAGKRRCRAVLLRGPRIALEHHGTSPHPEREQAAPR